MRNLRMKLVIIGIVAGAIIIGALFFYPWLEQQKELGRELTDIKENFRRCQNLENITITANPADPPPTEDTTAAINVLLEYVIHAGKSVDCLSLHDIYFCDLIEDEEKKTFCENTFYSIKAVKENNLDYCEKTGELKLLCQAILKKDESLCEETEAKANSSAISEFRACKAVVREDVKECENLGDKFKIQKCKINYYITLALLKKDISLCDKVAEFTKRKAVLNCRGILDVNECLKYHSEVQCPEIYLPQIAKISKDPSICEGIPYKDEDDKGKFLYQVCLKNAE